MFPGSGSVNLWGHYTPLLDVTLTLLSTTCGGTCPDHPHPMFKMRKLRPRGVQSLEADTEPGPLPCTPEGVGQSCKEGRAPILKMNLRYRKVLALPEEAVALLVFVIGYAIALAFW